MLSTLASNTFWGVFNFIRTLIGFPK